MKRLIALIISIAMVASLATGLAVTGFAEEGIFYTNADGTDANASSTGKILKFTVSGTDEVSVAKIDSTQTQGEITIPTTVTNGTTYKVTSIGNQAFESCHDLTNITIPGSVKTIGNNAFNDCKGLTSVTITDGVTSIGNKAFNGCNSLTNITIPGSVKTIGNNAFDGCSGLTSAIIENGVTSIGNNAFGKCSNLTSVIIPDSVTTIGTSVFQNCSKLESIKLPSGITSIENNTFNGCSSLKSITIPSGVTSIGNTAFNGCSSLKSITIPSGVTIINMGAFNGCSSLKSIAIPSGVTSIGDAAFYQCSSLESVTIGRGVETIGKMAFQSCTDLTTVTVEATTPPTLTNNNAFNGCTSLEKIYVPKDAADAYKVAPGWSAYASKIVKGITINGDEIEECIGSYGGNIISRTDNTITIDKIKTNTDTSIYIPSGNTLIVSNTDSDAISVGSGNLTITGGGEIDVYAFGTNSYVPAAIYAASGDINITDECTVKAIYEGDNDACAAIFALSGNINITNESKVTAIHKGDINEVGKGLPAAAIFAFGGDINITNESTVIATHEGDNIEGTAAAIYSTGKVNISDNSTVTAYASGTDVFGISGNNIDIVDAKKVNVNVLASDVSPTMTNTGILASGCLNISCTDVKATCLGADTIGLASEGEMNLSSGSHVESSGKMASFAITSSSNFKVDGKEINDTSYTDYFTGTNLSFGTVEVDYFKTLEFKAITGTNFVIFKAPKPNPGTDLEEDLDDEEENDPEVELDLGYGPVTLKTSNKSVVLNDKSIIEKMFDTAEEDTLVFDLTSTPVKLDGLFFNNDVFNVAKEANKKIEIDNRFAKAKVSTKNDIGQNPLSLHLSDVSEVPGTCATAIQKKAMQTDKVYAEVNYSFVSNGKPTDNNAKIYVPVDGPAKVFYLFNAEKIGIVPCEVKDGYCVFNRYFDGTYVICAK